MALTYDWREVSPNRWERNIDEAEIFYATLAKAYEGTRRMFFAITGHVSVGVHIKDHLHVDDQRVHFQQALKQGWIRLRHSHPTIASWTEYDAERNQFIKVYNAIGTDKHAEEWAQETLMFPETEKPGLEWCNSDPPAPKLPTLFVIFTKADDGVLSASIVLRSPHDVVDGMGTLHLLGVYLGYVSEMLSSNSPDHRPALGKEHVNLSPPLRVAANISEPLDEMTRQAFETVQQKNSLITSQSPIMSVPCPRHAVAPDAHQRAALTIASAQTAAILQACRARQVSITHAYHAAAAIVLATRQPRKSQPHTRTYVSYGLVDLRNQCKQPYNTTGHAASVYHCVTAGKFAIEFTIPEASASDPTLNHEFDRALEIVSSFYIANRPASLPNLPQLAPLLWRDGTPVLPKEAWTSETPLPIPPPNENPSISMSSFGVIDRIIPPQIGELEVHNPWVTGEELGNGIGLFLGTYRGELELSAAYNAAWHDKEEIQKYLKNIQDVVVQGLAI